MRQDLAFVVGDDVPASALAAAIREAGGAELRDVAVFDEYRGEQIGAGKRSLAFRVAFGSTERTLTDEDVAPRSRRDRRRCSASGSAPSFAASAAKPIPPASRTVSA